MSANKCCISDGALITTVMYKVLKDMLKNDRKIFADPEEMELWLKELEKQPGCFCN